MTVEPGWELRQSGPADAVHGVLLLPGGLCSADSYAELMAEPALAGIRLVAATLPGHAGTQPPRDLSIEHFARLAVELATDRGCDIVVGFSMGANVALEMAASGGFKGPVVLLGPCFSLRDEAMFLRMLDQLGRVFGKWPFVVMLRLVVVALKTSRLSQGRRDALLTDFRRNDPRVVRGLIRGYLDYLRRRGTIAPRLCRAAVPAWVVHAEHGDGGVTAKERRTLEACPRITMVTIPGTSFFLPNEEPGRIADLVVDAIRS